MLSTHFRPYFPKYPHLYQLLLFLPVFFLLSLALLLTVPHRRLSHLNLWTKPRTRSPHIPLCLLATWDHFPLPPYIPFSLQTLASSTPFAQPVLFIPPGTKTEVQQFLKQSPWPGLAETVRIVDVSESYKGWKNWDDFVGEIVCWAFGRWPHESVCNELRKAVGKRSEAHVGSNLVPLRPFYATLFHPYLTHCQTIAWVDLDTLWGRLPHFLNTNLVQNAIHTLAATDPYRLYTRGQFTAFSLEVGNELWKRCPAFSSLENTIEFFGSGQWAAIDEGCIVDVVLNSSEDHTKTIVVLPLQEADWNGPKMIRLEAGILTTCHARVPASNTEPDILDKCRTKMHNLSFTLSHQTTPPPFFSPPLQTQPITPYRPTEACSSWIPISQQWCVNDSPQSNSTGWWVQFLSGNTSEASFFVNHDLDVHGGAEEVDVYEIVLFHMQGWKKDLVIEEGEVASGVIEVFREGEKAVMRYL